MTSYNLHTSPQMEELLRFVEESDSRKSGDVLKFAFHSRADGPTSGLNGEGDCEAADPANTVTDRLNQLFSSKGQGYTLHLCPNSDYILNAPVKFAAANQELSTYGYPTDGSRASLIVMGPYVFFLSFFSWLPC